MRLYDYYSKLVFDPDLEGFVPLCAYSEFPEDCSHRYLSPLSSFQYLLDLFEYDRAIFEQLAESICKKEGDTHDNSIEKLVSDCRRKADPAP